RLPVPSSILLLLLYFAIASGFVSVASDEIRRGFSAAHDPSSYSQFQPLLADPTGVFALGFLRTEHSNLDLAVLHVASSSALWSASVSRRVRWADSVSLSFNGCLVLSDDEAGVLWSTSPVDAGDRVVLLNSSNIQMQKQVAESVLVLWQSFDFPSDTLVQGQNFSSVSDLFSRDRRFSMKLGESYFALYMDLPGGAPPSMYWKHSVLEAKAQIVPGGGAIYARVGEGFLGMYQTETAPVDVLPFNTFNRRIRGLRRLTLESDGNLRAYYWNGSIWIEDLRAVADRCEIPTSCGAYGLCNSADGGCSCLREEGECPPAVAGDFCAAGSNAFGILRRKGVDLANDELTAHRKVASLEQCEDSCERNCSCWGAIYHNASGYCYRLDYPITLVSANERKVGYFKVRASGGGGRRVKKAMLAVGGVLFAGAVAVAGFGVWKRRRGRRPVAYKDLNSASSQLIELSNTFNNEEHGSQFG
ncbi:PAN domain-containing protein At5g03700-like, partial [Curcuma longa]|uniref:PAN domain-containing protein At5g03700-like n=1 Tax=Curcuma longa TaxID=136217 RepID=UPI003D9E74AC